MNARANLARWLAGWLLVLASIGAYAQANVRSEVVRLDPPRPVATGERIEVIEFFYYGCPICYELEPHMTRWLTTQAPGYAALRRVPTPTQDGGETFARLFFALEEMGEVARLHWPIYDNFHFEGKALNEEKVLFEWLGKNGIDMARFTSLYRSAAIDAKLAEVRTLMKDYDVRGVPTLIIDGKYMTSARLAGGTRQLMQVVDSMVRQARSERAK